MPLGGPGSRVPVAGSAFPLAWLALAEGEVFVQPTPGAAVVCNGSRLSASHWLRDGDILQLGSTRCEVRLVGPLLRLQVEPLADERPTEPPLVLVPPPRDERLSRERTSAPIQPVSFTPRPPAPVRREGRPRFVAWLLVAAVLIPAGVGLALLARLALVEVRGGQRAGAAPTAQPEAVRSPAAPVTTPPATTPPAVRSPAAPVTTPPATTPPAVAVLVLRSEPPGARVWVEGRERGVTPVELRLAPGRDFALRLGLTGHEEAVYAVRLTPGQRREETVTLVASKGETRSEEAPPADAGLPVDGEPHGRAEPAPPARAESLPRLARSPEGHELRLVEGGRFRLGAPRRDPGRRANEPLRDVELVRRVYLATREVTNLQFRRFAPTHRSGSLGAVSLDADDQPVVRVSWQDAARYCNWLSGKEGLPAAYVERAGALVAAVPMAAGYRLPSEAEWERAARYPDSGREPLRFPWGAALPVPPRAGNYADERARGLVVQVLAGYDDGFPASAPVGLFAANPLGLFDLGGNVAEWTHDRYVVTPSLEGQVVRDPLGPAEGEYHVIRGASFLHGTVSELRLSAREQGREPRPDLGFRVARYAEAEGEP